MSHPYLGCVYVIDLGDKVKIGCSRDPESRVRKLKVLFGCEHGEHFISEKQVNYFKKEKECHGHFKDSMVGSELFGVFFSDAVAFVTSICKEESSDSLLSADMAYKAKLQSYKDGAESGMKWFNSTVFNKNNLNEVLLKDTFELSNICEDESIADKVMQSETDMDLLIVRCLALRDVLEQYIELTDMNEKLISEYKKRLYG